MTIKQLNIGLGVAAAAFLVFYVIQTNAMAAQAWRARDVQNQLTTLRNERTTLVAQRSQFDDRQHLQTLAEAAGMVPAGAVTYVVQGHAVAAR
jgi:hypothetical protein